MPFAPSTLTEKLMYSTVRIATESKAGPGVGTGFLYNFFFEDKSYCTIITARHVLQDVHSAEFRIHTANELPGQQGQLTGEQHLVTLNSVQDLCVFHPDETIDLCALDFLPIWESAKKQGNNLYNVALDQRYIFDNKTLAQRLSVVEDVIMVGYPIGVSDEFNNYPIFRRGTTATHPAIDFDNKPLVAIDIACFPGSSGSPVLIIYEGGAVRLKNGDSIFGLKTAILLGVFTHGVSMKPNGLLQINPLPILIPTIAQKRLVPINLGYYTKAIEIHKLAQKVAATFKSHKIVLQLPDPGI